MATFVDTRRDNLSGGTLEADVCVVGAGSAGISIARELADSPLEVIVVEGGGMEPAAGDRFAYQVVPGRPARLDYDQSKSSYFGGNTNHWFGHCRPLDDLDFEVRDWIEYSGWPVDHDELLPYYERAQSISGLGKLQWYDVEKCRPYLTKPPVDGLGSVFTTRIAQTCPVLSFAELFRQQLDVSQNVRILLGCRALYFSTDSDATSVSAVEIVDGVGRGRRVEARVFVLACGGVENARLLLCSNHVNRTGLGNDHDLVGRFFMEHWYFDFGLGGWHSDDFALYERRLGRQAFNENLEYVDDARVWAELSLSDEFMRNERVPGLSLWFVRAPPETPSVVAMRTIVSSLVGGAHANQRGTDARLVLTDPLALPPHLLRKLSGYLPTERRGDRQAHSAGYTLRVQIEQVPDPDNRIRLSTTHDRFDQPLAELALRLNEDERRAHVRSLKTAADALGLNGTRIARQMQIMVDAGRGDFFWHHMGTTRMSNDPRQGVVDSHCRVHGVSNLFVAGCSVFPTGGTAGPTLTIKALALRLADDLQGRETR